MTRLEGIIVIVILGIIATVSVPYMTASSKSLACKRALGVIRSAIANYYVYKATPGGGSSAIWPTLVQLTDGSTVLEGVLPDQPYSTGSNRNAVVAGTTKGTPVTGGTTGAWCYKAPTGEFWADTASGASESSW